MTIGYYVCLLELLLSDALGEFSSMSESLYCLSSFECCLVLCWLGWRLARLIIVFWATDDYCGFGA